RDQRTLLRHVIAEHLTQRLVQEMRRRMVLPYGAAADVVHFERQRRARLQRALLDGAAMDEHVAGVLLRIGDAKARAVAAHHPGIADLSAGLAVKRRLIEDDSAALAFLQRRDFRTVAH